LLHLIANPTRTDFLSASLGSGNQLLANEALTQSTHATSRVAGNDQRFTLVDKGLTHHVVLAIAVALPLFTDFVLVLCLTTSMPRQRKTLWALAILFVVTVLRFN